MIAHPIATAALRASLLSLVLSGAWSQPTAETYLDGKATHYAPGLMERVAGNRGLTLAGYHSGVALNRAGDLGRTAWLRWILYDEGGRPFEQVTGPHLVVDCAQREHMLVREERDYIVEVDATLAMELGFYALGPHPVRVWFSPFVGGIPRRRSIQPE